MKHNSVLTASAGREVRGVSPVLGSIALGVALTIVAVFVLLALPAGETMAQANVAGETRAQVSTAGEIGAQDVVSSAHVVVQFDDGSVVVRSITFTHPISGANVLAKTDLDFTQSGTLACGIEGIGCPADDCFCADNKWTQSLWDGSAWQQPWPFPDLQDGDVWAFAYDAGWPPVVAPAPPITAASKALDWLFTQQQADGGYGSASASVEVLMAVGANRMDASEWRQQAAGPSLLGFMSSRWSQYNQNAGAAGKSAVAATTALDCWPNTRQPMAYYDPDTGEFSANSLDQAWAMLGTSALSQTVPVSAVQSLKDAQQANGGWEFGEGWGTDTNATALAGQALIASGEPTASPVIADALTYLKSTQNATDAGFPYNPDGGWPGAENSDTNSTAYVVQALLAAGEDPTTGTWVVNNTNPISYLLSMQQPDGHFLWQGTSDGPDLTFSTRQVIPALLNSPFPVRVADLDVCPIQYLPVVFK
jgi:hypothetical protein